MRQGIRVQVSEGDRVRLAAIVADRNSPQKHVWRARIVLMTADGVGTNTIMRQTGKSKVTVWRWQERFMAQGVDGLVRGARSRAISDRMSRHRDLSHLEGHIAPVADDLSRRS